MRPFVWPQVSRYRLMGLASAVALTITLLPARTITVDDDGPADFRAIQEAIDSAAPGDVVSVLDGVYHENLVLKSGVAVVGAGSDRTTVNGGGASSTATLRGCAASTRLQGFTLTGGVAAIGGGILVVGGAPVITLNVIDGNRAIRPGAGLYGYGGGLALVQSAALVTENVVTGNDADFGGGIEVEGGSPQISRNVIRGNTAGAGGGIDSYAYLATGATITANTISVNSSIFGGGLELAGFGVPVVSNNLILGNTAAGNGAGSAIGGGADIYYGEVQFFNNTLGDNAARSGGGVAVLSDGVPAIVNNIFLNNQASSTGGAVDLQAPGVLVLNNIFHLNGRDTCGGASSFQCSEPTNLETDPLLVDPAAGDFRPRSESPAVDSGRGEGAPADDFRGQRRPLDGNGDLVPTVDRGAYEYDRNDVAGLAFATPSILVWKPVIGAGAYHVYDGLVSRLSQGAPYTCRDADDADRTDQSFVENREPPFGDGFAYLVTAVVAGVEQSPGFDSRGIERVLPASCP